MTIYFELVIHCLLQAKHQKICIFFWQQQKLLSSLNQFNYRKLQELCLQVLQFMDVFISIALKCLFFLKKEERFWLNFQLNKFLLHKYDQLKNFQLQLYIFSKTFRLFFDKLFFDYLLMLTKKFVKKFEFHTLIMDDILKNKIYG